MGKEIANGYYLFVYSEIDEIMNTLNTSLRHDHNMALFHRQEEKIELVRHWEFERVSGYKHHGIAFPTEKTFLEFVDVLLQEVGLNRKDLVSIIGTPFTNVEDISMIVNKYPNIAYHTVSHLYSSMLIDTNKFKEGSIIALAFDGGPDIVIDENAGEKDFFCGLVAKKGEIIDIFSIPSPGAYWAYVSNHFNIPEGTLMALAYASTAKSKEVFGEFPEYKRASDKMKVEHFLKGLINKIMNYDISMDTDKFEYYDERFSEKENKISIIMKIVQEKSMLQIQHVIDRILEVYKLDTKSTKIALSGGFALNCPTNTEIMHHYGFEEQLCCPCVNDGGLAIGMGLNYFHMNGNIVFKFENAFYGSEDKRDIVETLKNYKLFIKSISYGLEQIANDIKENPIVWFFSRAEVGPRALGHRSILANPCKMEHKDLLNKYKDREWWRPVAPIILEEELHNWFLEAFPSEYMLNNFLINPERREVVPAILHLDDTCRVQTINKKADAILYEVIYRFYKVTGVPIVCNTSLNAHGEPIINTIDEAMNFALRKGIETIYLNGYRVSLKNHKKYPINDCLKRRNELLVSTSSKSKLYERENPFNLNDDEMLIYKFNKSLHKYDLKNEKQVYILKKIIDKLKKSSLDLKGLEIISSKKK